MIFIVKDEHNEQRDRVSDFALHAIVRLTKTPVLDDRQACHEHPYEPAQRERGREWRSRR